MEQVVVFGENVPLVEVTGVGVNERMLEADVLAALQKAGYSAEEAVDKAKALADADFDIPSAWAVVELRDLKDIGIGPGRANAVIAEFRRLCLQRVGVRFARMMEGGESERTDSEVAAAILRAKHVPPAPEVKVETGWAPQVDAWREYVLSLASWLGVVDPEQAQAIRMIAKDWEVDEMALPVAVASRRSMALGSVLRGPSGLCGMLKLVSAGAMETGCGLLMIQDLCGTILAPMDEVDFSNWQHPEPVLKAHMVETAVMEWQKLRKQLRERGRGAVDDPVLARDALFELLGSCQTVKPILVHLKREHGRELTVEQCLKRVIVDSRGWLAERNQQGVRVESAFATIDAQFRGGGKQQNSSAGGSEYHAALAAVAEAQAALAVVVGVRGRKGGGKKGVKGREVVGASWATAFSTSSLRRAARGSSAGTDTIQTSWADSRMWLMALAGGRVLGLLKLEIAGRRTAHLLTSRCQAQKVPGMRAV